MIDLTGVKHHPAVQEIVGILCNKTQNNDEKFFRVESAFFLAKIASNMRATLVTQDRGEIPVNLYALILANSGFGKGHSVNIWENDLLSSFKSKFMNETMPVLSEQHMVEMAQNKALLNNTTEEEELNKLTSAYKRGGAYPFTFDSGTTPAVKQLRDKLLLAGCGAISLQIDEIGSNLISNTDILNAFLELYDQGMIKQKLTKNTNDNIRSEDLDGKTPSNMLLFGTPVKLLDGDKTEDEFYSFLETGYARRCVFALGNQEKKSFHELTPKEIFQRLTDPANNTLVAKWNATFGTLADPRLFNWKITVPDDVAIKLIEYRINCERVADALPDHEEIKKAELSHRYFKALKLAGAYAFVDKAFELSMDHLLSAILLVEESGNAFQSILNREKPYVKLAKFIASSGSELTHADLTEALPFYQKTASVRNEMMTLAIAWGYKQHLIIKKTTTDGIDFFKGETLKETNINEILVSYSNHFAFNYMAEKVPFDKLHILTQQDGYHFCNHGFVDGHRCDEKTIPGFNCIIVDCDGTIPLATAQELLKDVKYLMYTTKRHTEEQNRFRIIIPTNYILELDKQEYKDFMNGVLSWLPFEADQASNQRSHKWLTHPGSYFYNLDAPLLDVLPFIPKTTKNEQFRKSFAKIENLGNLERWFLTKMNQEGNRNNNLLAYALALKDSGESYSDVKNKVLALNKKLDSPLQETEIAATILVTLSRKYNNE